MSKISTLDDLAAAVASDSTVAIGGFQLSRVPVALLRAVAARGTKRLDAISAPNPLALDILAAAGCLRSVDCGFLGFQFEAGFVIPPTLKRAIATGEVALRQRDVYETIGDLRAAAGRLDALATDPGATASLAPLATQPGATEPRAPLAADPGAAGALADVTLLHAQRADRAGNLEIRDPYVDLLLASAGRRVLATAETLVERLDAPTVSADRVAGVAIVPGGAAPTACYGHYGRDARALEAYLGLTAGSSGEEAADVPTIASVEGQADANHDAVDGFLVDLARQVHDGEVVVTGLASAVPMLAIALARRTHAPHARYINCIGAVNPRTDRTLPTSVDPELLVGCEDTIDLPDLFDLARDGGVDAMFFGGGQIDVHGRINLSRIGPADAPKVRLPGPAGSPSMRSFVRRVVISAPRQTTRNLVAAVDVATSVPAERNAETVLVTDMATWRLTGSGFTPESLRPGVTPAELLSRTGFAFSAGSPVTARPPDDNERAALRIIDPAGLRFRLLGGSNSSRNRETSPERVLHER